MNGWLEVVDTILNEANAPINVDDVIALYLQRFKSTAKNVRKSARNKLRERIGHFRGLVGARTDAGSNRAAGAQRKRLRLKLASVG